MSRPDPAETRSAKRRKRRKRRRGSGDGDGGGGDDDSGARGAGADRPPPVPNPPHERRQQQQQQQVEGGLEIRGIEGEESSASSSSGVSTAAAVVAAAAAAADADDADAYDAAVYADDDGASDPLDGGASDPLVLLFDANQNSGEITYDGALVWGPRRRVRPVPRGAEREGLQREAGRLVTTTTTTTTKSSGGDGDKVRIHKGELAKLVKDAKGSKKWARYVARLTNVKRPEVENVAGQPQMLFQQLVFSPIAGLFYCFNKRTYKAGDVVSSGFRCSALTLQRARSASAVPREEASASRPTNGAFAFECEPDAATLATPKHFVLATMELTNAAAGTINDDDMFKCVLMTAITAVAMVRQGVSDRVSVPFVVNEAETAMLYVASMHKGWKAPVIESLLTADFGNLPERVHFIAHLAVLLHRLTKLVTSDGAENLNSILEHMPEQSRQNSQSASRSSYNDRPAKRQRTEGSSGPPSGHETEDRREAAAGAAEAAAAIASCEGRVSALVPFQEEFLGSPHYFWGERRFGVPGNGKADSPLPAAKASVFVKVWREGDGRTSRSRIASEIELLRLAHRAGVPCPFVVSELTQRSVQHHGRSFHRLVMERLANDRVKRCDMHWFALSLLRGVLRLHRAGILHCDIKPSNVVWDASTRTASLVDFGHAQRERGATAYPGTAGYTSPEVERQIEPHSRRSDAYSVGKTLEKVCGRHRSRGETDRCACEDRVLHVAARLARDPPDDRITLEVALGQLESSLAGGAHGANVSPPSAAARRAGVAATHMGY
jgi:Protein kinase domain